MKKNALMTFVLAVLAVFTCQAQGISPWASSNGAGKIDLSQMKVMPRPEGMISPEKIQFAPQQVRSTLGAFDQIDGTCDIFGFLVFDYRYKTNAAVTLNSNNAVGYSMLYDYGQRPAESYSLTAATYVGDQLYAYCCMFYGFGALVPISIGIVDPETGWYSKKYDLPAGTSILINDMTYDTKTSTIYGIQYNEDMETPTNSYSALCTINPNTGDMENLLNIEHLLYGIAAENGDLYGVARDMTKPKDAQNTAYLIKIPAANVQNGTYTAEKVGTTLGCNIYYLQSMEFDKINHKLYWLCNTANQGDSFCEINYANGTINKKQPFGSSVEIVALGIPYQTANDNAPSYPTNFKVTPATSGGMSAKLSWNNPALNYQNGTLSDLSGIKIYRNGTLLTDIPTQEMGAAMTWNDENLPASAFYTYKIMPYNSAGEGIYKEARSFVGRDLPGKVSSLTFTASGSTGNVSWSAPTSGVNNGWYDTSTLKYKVVRHPDEKVIAEATTETSFTDNVTKIAGYSYEIIPSNIDGQGIPTTTPIISYGPAFEPPYTNSMSTQAGFNEWTAVDANHDGVTWKYDVYDDITEYVFGDGPANDHLISPAINFTAGKQYQLRYTYWTINWVEPQTLEPVMEKMKVYYGQTPTAGGMTMMIADLGEFNTSSGNYLYGKNLFTPAGGEGYVSFNACSDAERGIIYLKDVSIREYSATDLSVTRLNGNTVVNTSKQQTFRVEVTNEGSAAVSNYKVQLYNYNTNEILGETVCTEPIDSEQTQDISVNWTPAQTGTIWVSARVVLDGDTYPEDNNWKNPLEVIISAAGDDWVTVNTDSPEVSGWSIPFSLNYCYGLHQVIFLDREMQLKNIELTGMQLRYDGADNLGTYNTPVKIKIMATDRDNFYIDDQYPYNVYMLDGNWTEVYDGSIIVGGTSADTNIPLIIEFDQPYIYRGGNIVVQYERPWNNSPLVSNESYCPKWHYCDIYDDGVPLRYRTADFKSNNTTVVDENLVGVSYWTPFTLFSYKDVHGSGIISATKNSLNIRQDGNVLNLGQICASVQICTVSGTVIATANKVNSMNVEGLKGVYLLKANVEGNDVVAKITLK